jgi:hypothetical protein
MKVKYKIGISIVVIAISGIVISILSKGVLDLTKIFGY